MNLSQQRTVHRFRLSKDADDLIHEAQPIAGSMQRAFEVILADGLAHIDEVLSMCRATDNEPLEVVRSLKLDQAVFRDLQVCADAADLIDTPQSSAWQRLMDCIIRIWGLKMLKDAAAAQPYSIVVTDREGYERRIHVDWSKPVLIGTAGGAWFRVDVNKTMRGKPVTD